jgi:nucleoid DNA-binding protein
MPAEDLLARLQAVWPRIEASLQRSLEVRGRERTDSLRKKLEDRAQKEEEDIRAILEELAATIQQELKQPELVQLPLFSDAEKDQYSRNQRALQARLRSIPEEIERETEAIRQRYAAPQPRLFPVAITFLIPEGIR